ncbi:MAG: type II secretion system protein [Magnetococcales bacterium]|nr:type II secretion system protein [Magnetococcales bacterium]
MIPSDILDGSGRRLDDGFTTLELIIVVMIMGILSVTAISLWPSGVDRVAAARQLANDIRLAQSYAMARGGGFRILSIDSTTYQIRRVTPETVMTGTNTLAKGTVTGFNIQFNSLGAATSGAGTITITDTDGSTDLTVIAATGAVIVP